LERFFGLLQEALADGSFVKMTVGHPVRGDAQLRQIRLRPVRLRGEVRIRFAAPPAFRSPEDTPSIRQSQSTASLSSAYARPRRCAANLTFAPATR
jgi:hypothetical protein